MYYKQVENGYITGFGEGYAAAPISEEEFAALYQLASQRPVASDGYDYRLREDLTWELYELPPKPEEDATSEDYEAALKRLGVET